MLIRQKLLNQSHHTRRMDLNELTCINDELLSEMQNKPTSSESTTNNLAPIEAPSSKTANPIDLNCWTPENKEGKKRYDRDFLISLKDKKNSRTFPDMLNDPNQMMSNKGYMQGNYDNYNKNKFSGSYGNGSMNKYKQKGYRHQSTVVSNSTDMVPSSRSNYGNRSENSSRASSHVTSISKQQSRDNSQSRSSESPSLGSSTSISTKDYTEDETNHIEKKPQDEHEEVFREVRNILNKLTGKNFVKLTGDLINLPINNEDRLKGLVEIIYENSINSNIYTEVYANICKVSFM